MSSTALFYRKWIDPTGFAYWMPIHVEQNPEANHTRTDETRYGVEVWDDDNENIIDVIGVTGE